LTLKVGEPEPKSGRKCLPNLILDLGRVEATDSTRA